MVQFISNKILLFILLSIFLYSGCTPTTNIHKRVIKSDPISSYFEKIKGNTSKLIPFLNNFPKGSDLHNHASGAAYIEFALEYALQNNFYYDTEQLHFVTPSKDIQLSDKKECDALSKDANCLVTVNKLISNATMLAKFLNITSIRGWYPNTTNGQDHFFNTFNHKYLPSGIKNEYLASIIARNYSQKISYIELMTSSVPKNLMQRAKSLIDKSSFKVNSMADNYEKLSHFLQSKMFKAEVITYMDKREHAVNKILKNKYKINTKGDTPDIIVRYIPQLYRLKSNFDVFIEAAVTMMASTIDERIVAINMVQNESALQSRINFHTQMKMLDFLWKKLSKPNIALHAGELVLRESPVEPMRNRISQSILVGHASRIGHGVSISWENNPSKILAFMKQHNIAIEICLSSNEMILGVKGKRHPFLLYKDAGVPITLATDDEGVFRSNLTMEYVKAVQSFNLSYKYIKEIARNGIKYSFLKGRGIYQIDGTIMPQFQRYIGKEEPTISKVSIKEYLQLKLENDFIKYSNSFHKL